jgi:hypothetical protein
MSNTPRRRSTTAPSAASSRRVKLDPLVVQAAGEVDLTLLEWALSLIQALLAAGVEFIVVGGAAAVLHARR